MPLNLSAVTPGPGGTTMLGEGGGIEAAARRGRERKKRKREAQENQVIDHSISGNTLTADPNKAEGDRKEQENNVDSKTMTRSTDDKTLPVDKSSSQDKSPRQDWFWTDNPDNAVGCADEVPSEYHPLSPVPIASTSSPVPTSLILATSSTSPLAITPLPTYLPPTKSSNENVGAIAGGVVGGVIGVMLIITALWLLRSRQRKKLQAQHQAQPPPSLQPINGIKDSQIPVSEFHYQTSPSEIGRESGAVYELPQGN